MQQLQAFQHQLMDADARTKSVGQQLQDVQQQLVNADVLIRGFGQEIKSCEERLDVEPQDVVVG